ncbi:MAG TPA: hypothetical protein VHH72_06005 [Solirubrobacterales bacterium]|jgi:hypothetical protein|nr:hypothetical protein [Solirubrobacterales bacterium]
MEASANRIDAGRVISEAFATYREYVGPLLGGALVLIGVAALVSGLLGSTDSVVLSLLGSVVVIAAQFLYTGYVVKLVQDVRDGRRDQTVGELLSAAMPYIVPLALNGILAGIGIFIGFLLLIVPGLILLTIWAVVSPAIVVENRGVIEAFGRSRELVRGQGWTVFAVIVLAFLIVVAVSIAAGLIGDAIGDDAGRVIVQAIGSVVTVPFAGLVASILFFDLGGGSAAPAAPEPLPSA